MIKIMKASAGSGKTYNLSHTYLDMLLSSGDPYAYRHILAVTFTNKATAEMKTRILKDLAKKAADDPRAAEMLTRILHDYSAFSISTIDKFFQQTLKCFAREIGQFAGYRIELDKKSLVQEAMDRIMDALTSDNEAILSWFDSRLDESLSAGNRPDFDTSLYEMGERLKNDDFRKMVEDRSLDIHTVFSKERLASVRKECDIIIKEFHRKVRQAARELAPAVPEKAEKYLEPYLNLKDWDKMSYPKKTLMKYADGSRFENLFLSREYEIYNTARAISSQIFSLGVADEFFRSFSEVMKEKNVMCLDESNTILRDLIDGSDAPFVYEKLGVRFENFLLDEFQDTSYVQWDNFQPLLKESDSKLCDNLIVGDVKQSIYRWRGSEWQLLANGVKNAFPTAEETALDCNWRSAKEIVRFNNDFFKFAAEKLGLEEIYSDVVQIPMSKEAQAGQVKVTFTDKDGECAAVTQSVAAAREAGARFSDIAVLVRGHAQGGLVAAALLDAGVPVVSDDSLDVKSSPVVKRVVSLLRCMDNPADSLGTYLAGMLGIDVPSSYHSIYDLCEGLLRELKDSTSGIFDGQTLFIQSFLDDVQQFETDNSSNLHYYLQHFDNAKLFISSPEDNDAVRVITIHKSKGLEFPYVIFPFAEKVELTSTESRWVYLEAAKDLPEVLQGPYYVELSSTSELSLFKEAYGEEMRKQVVDNMNVFYVALTRAARTLHIIASNPSNDFVKSLKSGEPQYKYLSNLLYQFTGENENYVRGKDYDFNRMERPEAERPRLFSCEFYSCPVNPDPENPRLRCSDDASDYFSEEGVGAAGKARADGIRLHSVLEKIHSSDDLGAALQGEPEEVADLIARRVKSHPEWFAPSLEVHNEEEIISAGGEFYRPDRVIVDGRNVTIIDYKFGDALAGYRKQVGRYAGIYRSLGFEKVESYLWYVRDDIVEKV